MPAYHDQDKDKAIKSIAFSKRAMINAFYEADIHESRDTPENGQVVCNDTTQSTIANASIINNILYTRN